MNELLSLNLFTISLPATLAGVGLLGGLVLLPLLFSDDSDRRAGDVAACCRPSN